MTVQTGSREPATAPSKRLQVDEEEWAARVDLAAAYRLVAMHGWTHLINSHISARVPNHPDQFLINPMGLLFEQITASNLVKVDFDGKIIDDTPYGINEVGFVIHSAIHRGRPDIHAVLHTHTIAGMALSALDCGILPMTQSAMRFHGRTGYHDFERVAEDVSERDRIVRDLGPHKALVLRQHGLLTAGTNVAEAFYLMYHLEKVCATQLAVLASGQPYSLLTESSSKNVGEFMDRLAPFGQTEWPALLELAASVDPSYRE